MVNITSRFTENTYLKILRNAAQKGNKRAQERLSGGVPRITQEDEKIIHAKVGNSRFMPNLPMRPCAVCGKLTPKTIPQIDDQGEEYEMYIHNRCLKRMAHDEDEEVI